jgi:hypothetical protein
VSIQRCQGFGPPPAFSPMSGYCSSAQTEGWPERGAERSWAIALIRRHQPADPLSNIDAVQHLKVPFAQAVVRVGVAAVVPNALTEWLIIRALLAEAPRTERCRMRRLHSALFATHGASERPNPSQVSGIAVRPTARF